VAAGILAALLFGAATPASKALLNGLHPQTLAGLLYLGAAIGMLPLGLKDRPFLWPWHAERRTFLLLAGAVAMGGIAGPLLILMGLRTVSAGSASLWLNLEFVATVLLGHFMFRDYLTMRGWVAAAGTLFAAVVLVGTEGTAVVFPVLLIALGCVCWGFDNHFTALIDGIPPSQVTLWKGCVAGTFNLVAGVAVTAAVGSTVLVLLALGVGAVSYGFSITLYVTAAQGLGATRSQMLFSSAPFFGLLLSVTVLGEAFTGAQVAAAVCMLLALVVLFSERHSHVHRHAAKLHRHRHRHDDGHHDHPHDGLDKSVNHVHEHEHEPGEHAHEHWPDLHHRHDHGSKGA
jgi:drug/metabolite transporter (DMT)-like permease